MRDERVTFTRTVKPRKPATNADRPIIVIIDELACDESGTVTTADELIGKLRTLPPQIIVTANESASVLKRIQDRYGSNPNFNFRVTPIEREIFTGKDTGRKLCLSLTSVSYFGWSKEKCGRGNTLRNRYHLLIDPLTFSNDWLADRDFPTYLKWMQDIRAFCLAQNWNLRPTQGGIARQALQDSRFYPDARRKVPLATNERVRPQLPGNHYQLGSKAIISPEYEAVYLDQSRCHHNQAKTVGLPDANSLYGYGHYRNPEATTKPYKRTPERIAQFLAGFMGMIYGTVWWPVNRRNETEFLPKCLKGYSDSPNKPIYFYSEDLPLFESLGVRVTGIIAAWGSKRRDTGLPKYADWAIQELATNAPPWKKSLLLSPYGSLATTPQQQTTAYHQSKRGSKQTLRTKYGTELTVSFHKTSKVSEPSTNNVLHRALIEAGNRTDTLLYARYLESLGHNVLCIYVDALLVETKDGPLPVPAPWRIDENLTGLRFLSPSRFTSDQMKRLPGTPSREYQRATDALLAAGGKLKQLTPEAFELVRYRAYLHNCSIPPKLAF